MIKQEASYINNTSSMKELEEEVKKFL